MAKSISFLLLLITVFPSDARETRLFSKVPAAAAGNDVAPVKDQPDFLPETESGYGLDPAGVTPTATSAVETRHPVNRYLPKNYNPESYVTEPEDATDFATNSNNSPGGDRNYRFTPEEKTAEYGNAAFSNRRGNDGLGPQGMSDTRSLENGKYYYDINSEKYNDNHPYETMKSSYHGNGEGGYGFNRGQNSGGARNVYRGRDNYYGNEYGFNGGKNENYVGGYENEGDEGVNGNYRP